MSRYEPGTVYNCPSHELRLYRDGNLLVCPIARHGQDEPRARGIICPRCQMVSFNPNDVREGYCGHCHDWTTASITDP